MRILEKLFGDIGQTSQKRFPLSDRRLLVAATVIACLAALALAVYASYIAGGPYSAGEPPLVRAAEGPTKIRPDQPGGLNVPNQEILVYDVIKPDTESRPPERLLPPPEEPLDIPASQISPPTSAVVPPSEPMSKPTATTTMAKPLPSTRAPGDQLPANETDIYRVQLGAFGSSESARKQWQNLRNQHGELLNRLEARFQRVDRPSSGGSIFRIQAGPLAKEATARNLCAALKTRGVDCLVVAP